MYCMKCHHDLSECTCPDLGERLRAVSESPNIAMKWCTVCDRHYSQCPCANPVWTVRSCGTPNEELVPALMERMATPVSVSKGPRHRLRPDLACLRCQDGSHHPTEHDRRATPTEGDVVFVRAVVTKVMVHDFSTEIHVKEFEPGYPGEFYWKAKVNSVDVYSTGTEVPEPVGESGDARESPAA